MNPTDPTPSYPAWKQTYSGEDFDRAQAEAQRLTDLDRAAGRDAPRVGYSTANFGRAVLAVRKAQR